MLLELCDRIVVLCGGQVSGVVDARTADKRQIGALMTRMREARQMNKKQSLFHIAKRDTLPWYKSFAIRAVPFCWLWWSARWSLCC